MTVEEALKAVVAESNNDTAKAYARAALENGGAKDVCFVQTDRLPGAVFVAHENTGKPMTGNEMRVQILYLLNNLGHWRGQRARDVKAVLKEASK
jgi:hypothetical protein